MTPRAAAARRSTALGAAALGLLLLLVAGERRWVTVPSALTAQGRDVALPGSVLFEIGRLYGLLGIGLLAVVLSARGLRRRAAAGCLALVGVLAFSQALDSAVSPGKAVVRSDEGLTRLGFASGASLQERQAIETAPLPGSTWPLLSVLGTALLVAGAAAVVAREGAWASAGSAEGEVRGWWER